MMRIKWLNKTYRGIEFNIDIKWRRILRKHSFAPENCVASLTFNLSKNHIKERADIFLYTVVDHEFFKNSQVHVEIYLVVPLTCIAATIPIASFLYYYK